MTMPNQTPHTVFQHPLGRALALISALGFVGLFPYFFIYHFAISLGGIPPFMGGAFGLQTVLIVLLAILPYLVIQRQFDRSTLAMTVPFHLLVVYVLFWVVVNNLSPQNEAIVDKATAQLIALVVAWVALFIIGVFIPGSNRTLRRALLALWAVMIVVVLVSFDRHVLALDLSQGDTEIATYKELARSVMYVGLFLAQAIKSRPLRLALISATIIALFFVGARSELLGFAGACVLIEALISRRSLAGQILLGLMVLAVAWIAIDNLDIVRLSRVSALLDLASDQSWNERARAQALALEQIRSAPMLGVYGGHLLIGQAGYYAHNALSAWVSLGLVGFLIYVGLTIYCTGTTFLEVWRNPGSSAWRLALAVNFISVIFLIGAQGVFWSLPALGWGLAVRARLMRPPARRRSHPAQALRPALRYGGRP